MQHNSLRIGLIEDDPVMGGSIVQRLEIEGCSVSWWQKGGDLVKIKDAVLDQLDLLVCDIRLPDLSGEEIYEEINRRSKAPPFIFVTGFGEIDQAVRLMRNGAADYLTKPFDFEDFLARIRKNARTPAKIADEYEPVLGVSVEMREAAALLRRYAGLDLPVLITGESGVGKEVAAKYLHYQGRATHGPFMAVNCAAIPPDLLESEIFGHERGAFSGAVKQHRGYAERAAEGTLFLDEIGDMPLALQSKILRLIEERKFYRIGGEREIDLKARIVAATHQDLMDGCEKKTFREDLFFRISVLPITLSPLRSRPDDALWMMSQMLADATLRQERTIHGVSTATEEMVLEHPWPGNARELRNRIERAVAVGSGEWIMPCDLFPDFATRDISASESFASLSEVRHSAERRQIERALEHTGGQVLEAAKLLGISRTTLWEKMTRYELGEQRSDS